MPPKLESWDAYKRALDPFDYGHALWEPGPVPRRARPGDVGHIYRGQFHLLFSAGIPLGSRVLGIDVPYTFEPLDVGPIVSSDRRPPGYLSTDTVRQVGADVGGSAAVPLTLESGAKITFELTQKQGGALITKDYTHREDVQREGTFKRYTKRHYDSWVTFAQERGHGGGVRPILVTGVDLTKEFAMFAYSDNQTPLECEFSVHGPTFGSASVSPTWGSWRTRGLVHTNCGPNSTWGNRSSDESAVPKTNEYDQCVFIRYYTVRKNAFRIPTVIKVGAGPHQLPEGNHGNDNSSGDRLQPLSVGEPIEVDHPETYLNKKIVDLSDTELIALGFMGESVAPGVKTIVEAVKADPDSLGSVTCFMVDCLRRKAAVQSCSQDAPPNSSISPTFPTLSDTETLFPQLSNNLDAHTVIAPYLISKYEMNFWYHGISGNPPKLMYRSDLKTNPFPIPLPGTNFFKIPTKTAHGVFNTPLNAVWDTVAPQILESIKAHGLQYSALKTARFSTIEDGKDETFGPVVVWIAVRPNTTNAEAVRDATPDILNILTNAQITNVVVEWYEGLVTRLVGPPLMSIVDKTSAKFGLNHPFNTGLGIPIARQSDDAQGTLTFLFKEMKTSSGKPSNRILGLTNKHIASLDTTTDYELNEADPQYILICGDRRLTRAVTEIEDAVTTGLREATRLARELKDTPKEDTSALRRRRHALEDKNEDNITLQALFTEVTTDWQDTNSRRFGVVDYAPHISVSVDNRPYTRDIATFIVDGEKLKNFKSNIIDLGNQYNASQLEDLFWPITAIREGKRIPDNLQLPIHAALSRRLVMNPETEDKNGESLSIVGKYGNTTKLTLGRYSGMEAYTCTDLGLESREVAVYNYSKTSGSFSDHGDSGSLIFTGDGSALAMLHSGMPRGLHNHVTYGTPIWWVIKQILVKYPNAKFYGMTYTLD